MYMCFVETKLENADSIDIPGYSFYYNNRNRKSRNKSGGIAVGISERLQHSITVHPVSSELILWIQISSDYVRADNGNDICIAVTYIPPEGSPYYTTDTFIEMDREISQKQSDFNVSVIGDLNSRTRTLPDYILLDNHVTDQLDLPEDLTIHMNDATNIKNCGISLERFNKDNSPPNSHGYKFIELCKINNLYIANGRVGKDKGHGKITCKGTSTVDYVVACADVITLISDFEVLEFDPLFSDVHCALVLELPTRSLSDRHMDDTRDNTPSVTRLRRWNNTKAREFRDSIDSDIVNSILDNVTDTSDRNTCDVINETVEELTNLLLNTASNVFGHTKPTILPNKA